MIGAILDHLWQSTVFAGAAGALTLLVRTNGARIRYGLWLAASLKFLVPFSALAAIGATAAQAWKPDPARLTPGVDAMLLAAQPFSQSAAQPSAESASALPLGVALLVLWSVGVVVVLAVWAARWRRVAAVARAARDLPIAAPIPVRSTASLQEPGLIGVRRPVLLLPEGIEARLRSDELDAILAHELCHWRRRDNLTASLHMAVEALFWFHPLVWWLGARLVDAREQACDERVVADGNNPRAYADAILKVCRHYLRSPLPCAAGVSGGELKKRMERIMSDDVPARLSAAKRTLLAAAAVAAVVAPVSLGLMGPRPAVAQTALKATTAEQVAALKAEQEAPRKVVPFVSSHFDKYVGYYQLAPEAVFKISRDGDKLLTQLTGQPPVQVYPESESKFFATVVAAQVSFNTDAKGKVTELVLHQNGGEMHAPRTEAAKWQAQQAAVTKRINGNKPDPATEPFLRRYIASQEAGKPDYSQMGPGLAEAAQAQQGRFSADIKRLGPLKSIRFLGVNPAGADQYRLVFQNGELTALVAPPKTVGKIPGLLFQP